MPAEQDFEAVVIGAGVSGLAAAARLAQTGIRTLLIEGNSQPGGRCSTRLINGHSFDIGAMYVGSRAVEILREAFGEEVRVKPAFVGVRWHQNWVTLPPNRWMLLDLLRCGVSPFEIGRFCWNLRLLFGEKLFLQSRSLAEVVQRLSPDPVIREVLYTGLGVSGMSLKYLPPQIMQMGRNQRGTQVGNPVQLEGGNEEVARRLLDVFNRGGGRICFEQRVDRIERDNDGWCIFTGEKRIFTRAVISTTGVKSTILHLTAPELWPENYYQAALGQTDTLEMVNIFASISVPTNLPNQYSLYLLPVNILEQFDALESGQYPVHPMFGCQIPGRGSADGQTVGATIQFYHPRAAESSEQIEKQVRWVMNEGLEQLARGLSRQVVWYDVYPPSRYEAEFGMRPYIFATAPLVGRPRFSGITPLPGFFLAGDSVEPERPSVPQAMESGLNAAGYARDWLRSSGYGS